MGTMTNTYYDVSEMVVGDSELKQSSRRDQKSRKVTGFVERQSNSLSNG